MKKGGLESNGIDWLGHLLSDLAMGLGDIVRDERAGWLDLIVAVVF